MYCRYSLSHVTLANRHGLDHLSFRLWVGAWMSLILIFVCIFNGSYLVVFITRFTEELFASFIAVIFIIQAITKIYNVWTEFPVSGEESEPNVFLMSLLLFCATYTIAVKLKEFKDAPVINVIRFVIYFVFI